MILTIINTLIALYGGLSPLGDYPSDYGPNLSDGDEFDFIVVGAGSAGSVVANRLSENTQWKVLLIEAGGYPSDMSEVPALAFSLQRSEEDWQYKTEPSETSCMASDTNQCSYPRGKVLGGSSSINLMMYTRSTKYDHERWASDGNYGWDYESVGQYYKKFENVDIENNQYYGTTGELHLSRYTSNHPLRHILQDAYRETGSAKYTEDSPIGFRDILVSIHQGTRQNTAKSFLIPTKQRKNLYLATHAQVSRLLINGDNLAVYGVEVRIGDKILKLKANKEVVLSAGSINSPAILMNSGIGPKEHLSEIGIEVIRDLKVGENLQDHFGFPFVMMAIDESAVKSLSLLQLVNEVYQYFTHGLGALGTIDITNFCQFFHTKNETDFANIQLAHILIPHQDQFVSKQIFKALETPEDVSQSVLKYNQNFPILTFLPILLQPKSRGLVRLQNSDPFSKPRVTTNFLSDKNNDDIEVMLEAIKYLQKLAETKAFAAYNQKIIDVSIPNCREFVPKSDDFWKCAIRNIGMSMYHPVGTCKMGPGSDATAVVDPRLRVHGVKGVRVIDGSIMPTITSSNTNAPIIMSGEKGASLIREDWTTKHEEL